MAFPKRSEIELPILLEVASAGGHTRPNPQLFREVAKYFPNLTDDDLTSINRTCINTWENKVHWARLVLVHKGEIDKSSYGVWQITEKGRARIGNEVGSLTEPAKKEETVHTRLGRMVEEIGRSFGKYARRELKEGPYSYDVVWKDADWLPRCTHVFEVQDKGSVLEALVRLKHSYDNWGSKLFLVVTGEKDRGRVEKLLVPYFSGAFHEIGQITTLMAPDEVEELHEVVTRYRSVISKFVAR